MIDVRNVMCENSENQSEQIDIPLPKYATDGSAGMDICAARGSGY